MNNEQYEIQKERVEHYEEVGKLIKNMETDLADIKAHTIDICYCYGSYKRTSLDERRQDFYDNMKNTIISSYEQEINKLKQEQGDI